LLHLRLICFECGGTHGYRVSNFISLPYGL
jgi:hypothetical protein